MSWEKGIVFQKNEKMINSWLGKKQFATRVRVQGRTQVKVNAERGAFVLTNQRLIFLSQFGHFEKTYHQRWVLPLEKIKGISMFRRLRRNVIVIEADAYASYSGGRDFMIIDGIGKEEFDSFRSPIMELIQKRVEEIEAEVEAEKKKERVQLQIVVDFSTLKEYMEKGGLVLQNTKCPECNAPIPIPTSGNQVICQHCGSTIQAQDLFEKIRSLV